MSGSQGRCCRHDFHFPIQKSRNLDMVPREHDYLKALSGNRESGSDQGEWFRFKSLVSITWIKRGLSSIFRALFLDDRIAELGANRNRGYPSCTRCRKEGLKSSISSIFGGYFEVIHLEIRDFVRSDPRRNHAAVWLLTRSGVPGWDRCGLHGAPGSIQRRPRPTPAARSFRRRLRDHSA